jgi:glycosyltransferase involved in cell wall biosynthesis
MRRRIALVTQGLAHGGGVSTAARWLCDELASIDGYTVDLHDLATSSRDLYSRRILQPNTWLRKSLRGPFNEELNAQPWGANLVELESMRYRPRTELTRALRSYDLIQVVAGGPALASTVTTTGPPVVLQVATTLRWERQARRTTASASLLVWQDAMTALASRIELRALREVNAVLVMNDVMLSFVSDVGQINVVKAPPGVDTERFLPPVTGWNRQGYLLSVCRLSDPRKRLDRLIRAYRELVRIDEAAPNLVLAGYGELSDEVHRLIRDSGLGPHIVIRQDVQAVELCELYAGASVYVQTSQEEGLGMSILEAMACGLPVVATDTAGAMESVVEGVTGWMVRQEPEHEFATLFADRVANVLARTGPSMAVAARERCIDIFSTDVAIARFTAVYDRLLASARNDS